VIRPSDWGDRSDARRLKGQCEKTWAGVLQEPRDGRDPGMTLAVRGASSQIAHDTEGGSLRPRGNPHVTVPGVAAEARRGW